MSKSSRTSSGLEKDPTHYTMENIGTVIEELRTEVVGLKLKLEVVMAGGSLLELSMARHGLLSSSGSEDDAENNREDYLVAFTKGDTKAAAEIAEKELAKDSIIRDFITSYQGTGIHPNDMVDAHTTASQVFLDLLVKKKLATKEEILAGYDKVINEGIDHTTNWVNEYLTRMESKLSEKHGE